MTDPNYDGDSKWVRMNIDGARKLLIRAFKEDPGFLKGYIDNAADAILDEASRHNESFILSRPAVRESLAKAVLNCLFNPRELDAPFTFQVGKYYRHKHGGDRLLTGNDRGCLYFRIIASVETTHYGQTLLAETLSGFKAVGSDADSAKNYEEIPKSEWESQFSA